MLLDTQSELTKMSETPPDNAPAEQHVTRAIERFYCRKNATSDVKIDAFQLEEFYNLYKSQQKELSELKHKMKAARKLLKI